MRESLKLINKHCIGKTEGLIGAEIGVRTGLNALDMLRSMNIKHLYLVDHFKEHLESSGELVTQAQQDSYYMELVKNMMPYSNKTTIISQSSAFASQMFEDETFDFVYIDAGHKYEQVLQDMRLWLPKVKKKGYLCGHDFSNKCTPEVEAAVKDFCKKHGLSLFPMEDLDWLCIK